jgi:mannose-1-phosphate guanylyltransferase/mannose-6-phosphate isomerase
MVIPIILCGGGGTRLWPLSRPECPKPFLPLFENEPTLFQQTLQRAALFAPPLVICHAAHLPLVQNQCDEIGIAPRAIILEPQSQGTAAAMAVACLHLKSTCEDAAILMLPADLVIRNQTAFKSAVDTALPFLEKNNTVTFGIKPTRAEPRYGYIETANAIEEDIFQMKRFTEKPSLQTATRWLADQKYFWNSGMLLLSLAKVLFDLQSSQKSLMQSCSHTLQNSQNINGIITLEEKSFCQTPRLSFEKAVMEQSNKGILVQANFDWNDAGTWESLWELQAKNSDDNVSHGNTRVQDSKGCYVHANTKRVSVLGCENLVIIETEDEVLVTTREAADRIGQFADK